jgi:hypothetical protein
MYEYGTCECYNCYRRVPKPEAQRITIDRETGHSSGNFGIGGSSSRYSSGNFRTGSNLSYYTGRKYYRKQEVWLCNDCFEQYRKQREPRSIRSIGIAVLVIAGLAVIAGRSQNVPQSTPPSTLPPGPSSNHTATTIPATPSTPTPQYPPTPYPAPNPFHRISNLHGGMRCCSIWSSTRNIRVEQNHAARKGS